MIITSLYFSGYSLCCLSLSKALPVYLHFGALNQANVLKNLNFRVLAHSSSTKRIPIPQLCVQRAEWLLLGPVAPACVPKAASVYIAF